MPPKRSNTSMSASPAPQQPQLGYGLALPGQNPGWGAMGGQIPIDPALQSPGQYAGYYAYPAYNQYQQQMAQQYAQHQQQQMAAQQHATASASAHTPTIPAAPSRQNTSSGGGGGGEDITSLNDVLGSAGVDIRAEEEGLHRQQTTYRIPTGGPQFDRSRRSVQPLPHLAQTLRKVALHHNVPNVPEESIQYLQFALQMRLTEILTQTVSAAKHRTRSDVLDPAPMYEDGETPMWSKVVRRDVGKQLALLERIEREEEMKKRTERKERLNPNSMTNANSEEDMRDDDDETPKKKRKKEMGPGVTAKNMSEETRKKMSDAVATQAAGLSKGKYSWMHAGNVPSTGPAKPKAPTPATATATATSTQGTGKGWARGPFVSNKEKEKEKPVAEVDTRMEVTLRDAMFVIEKERGHGGGRGSARGWT